MGNWKNKGFSQAFAIFLIISITIIFIGILTFWPQIKVNYYLPAKSYLQDFLSNLRGTDQNLNQNINSTLPDSKSCQSDADCIVSGCNQEICANQSLTSICIFKPEFACYQKSSCLCIDNQCDWESNEDFLNCLEEKRSSEGLDIE